MIYYSAYPIKIVHGDLFADPQRGGDVCQKGKKPQNCNYYEVETTSTFPKTVCNYAQMSARGESSLVSANEMQKSVDRPRAHILIMYNTDARTRIQFTMLICEKITTLLMMVRTGHHH